MGMQSKSIPRVRTANPYESPLRSSPLRKSRSPSRDFTSTISPVYHTGATLHMAKYSPRMASPMTYGEEKDLVFVLKDLMNLETDLENAKCDLSLKPDFNLVDCFRIFDFS